MFPTAAPEEEIRITSQAENNINVTRDVPKATETSPVAKQQNRDLTLNMLFKEMIICVALALTTYGALHRSPTKISKHPPAVRFFDEDSFVTDWYKGQLSSALVAINKADVSFVMYYAPWDAECQYVRSEFETVASILGDRVHFSAINCWNPGSECRLLHNKIPSWPVIMAYTVTSRGVLYKGPKDAPSMISFLELIMKPINRVSSTEDLVFLLSICDAVALGYTPLHEGSQHYNTWYNVALKLREFDTIGEICFASVTSELLAHDLGATTIPYMALILWNETKGYPTHSHSWNETALTDWILENFSQPVARVIPMWKKAFSFDKYNDGNPILMLFTPLNPLYEVLPNYALLREVAMEYLNCDNESSEFILERLKLLRVQRTHYKKSNLRKLCQEYNFNEPLKHIYKKEIVNKYNKLIWHNITQKSKWDNSVNLPWKRNLLTSKVSDGIEIDAGLFPPLNTNEECTFSNQILDGQCQSFDNAQNRVLFEDDEIVETSMLPTEDDLLSSRHLNEDNIKHHCKLINYAYKLGAPVFPAKDINSTVTPIHGLSCTQNYTLHMIAVDSVRNYHFAESLGLDIRNMKDMTAVIILDSKLENQYVLSQEYSPKSLREFVYNFTKSRLRRTLRTNVRDAVNTHYYGSSGDVTRSDSNGTDVRVIDLSTRTFRKVISTPGVVTLVAVCAGACGALTTRALISASQFLSECDVAVQVARIDTKRHELPWHYTPDQYPTVIVFPPHSSSESESRISPLEHRITSGSIVAVTLRTLGFPQHVRVRFALCQRAKYTNEKKNCLRDIREQILKVIERNLKYWRQTDIPELREVLFKRLEILHQVSLNLHLINIADLIYGNKKKLLFNSLDRLINVWNIDSMLIQSNKTVKHKSKNS